MIITMQFDSWKIKGGAIGYFDSSPKPLINADGDKFGIDFGNSGFMIRVFNEKGRDTCYFDFTPEKKYGPSGNPARYAKILGASLYGLWNWLNNPPDDQTKLSARFHSIQALTNKEMISSITNLFSGFEHPSMTSTYPSALSLDGGIKIDLDSFKKLSSDDQLIEKLRQYDSMCKEMQVSYMV